MKDYKVEMNIPVSAAHLYDSIHTQNGVRNWWTKFANISDEVGGISEFNFLKAGFYVVTRNKALKQNKIVEWDVIDSKHPASSGFDNLKDWIGTTIQFHIESLSENESKLHFTHKGLTPALECFDACDNGWRHYLNSLKDFAVGQEGEPYTDDSENNIIR